MFTNYLVINWQLHSAEKVASLQELVKNAEKGR